MTSDVAQSSGTPVPTNHPTGFWFFFWGEFAERCSYYGMRAILALYMIDRLGVDKADAGTYMSLFIAACYFFPLLGGFIADNFFGKYWTIIGFSLPYVLAQFMVGIENKYLVAGSLLLLAMGSGVIKPNISTLMGLTYDQQRPGQKQLRTSAFSWFYMSINIGAALSQFAMPWLRTKYGYQVAFLFPAGLMSLALLIFGLGKRFYAKEKIERKIVGNAEDMPADSKTITGVPVTYHAVTAQQAARELALKWMTLGRLGALFLTVLFFWAIFDQSASTWIFFADTYMDTTLIGERTDGTAMIMSGDSAKNTFGTRYFRMSADAIQAFNPIFIVIFVPISVWFFKKLDRSGWKIKATQKMLIGYFLTGSTMLIMSVAGFMTKEKFDVIKITTKEGEIILPKSNTPLDKVTPPSGQSPSDQLELAFGSDVKLTTTEWTYNKDNKKVVLTNGKFLLPNGKVLVITNGRIDFAASTGTIENGVFKVPGVLELRLKPGTYAHGSGSLVLDEQNKVEIKSEALEKKDEKEPPKTTLEKAEWTKPEERVTVWWKIFAFLIITLGEILISVTGLELAFVVAPDTMKSFVTACWLSIVFFANLVNALLTRLYPIMEPGIYFAMMAAAMGVVIVAFVPIAARFNRSLTATADVSEAVSEEK